MPNRITRNNTLSISGTTGSASATGANSIDQVGTHFIENIQDCAAGVWETIDIGDIDTLGYLHLRNLDATNYVEVAIANDGSGIFASLLPGQSMDVAVQAGATYYLRAHTAQVSIGYLAIEL